MDQVVAHQVVGRVRQQDLPAVPGAHQACRPAQGDAVVVAAVLLGDARVQAHAHPHPGVLGPPLGEEGPLGGERRPDRLSGGVEGRAEGVAALAEDVAAAGLYGTLQNPVVTLHGGVHLGGVVLVQGGGALYVGEEEGDGAGRGSGHSLARPPAPCPGRDAPQSAAPEINSSRLLRRPEPSRSRTYPKRSRVPAFLLSRIQVTRRTLIENGPTLADHRTSRKRGPGSP